jgi:hypothetical protein
VLTAKNSLRYVQGSVWVKKGEGREGTVITVVIVRLVREGRGRGRRREGRGERI